MRRGNQESRYTYISPILNPTALISAAYYFTATTEAVGVVKEKRKKSNPM